jgi:predicted metal-dependent peptidase
MATKEEAAKTAAAKKSYKQKKQFWMKNGPKDIDPNSEEVQAKVDKAVKRFSWCIGFMAMTDHFNYEVLGRLQLVADVHFSTLGVSPVGILVQMKYNPLFVDTLTDEELRYALGHEVLHIVLHHITRRPPADRSQATIDNWAADLAINSLQPSSGDRCYPYYHEDLYNGAGKLVGKKGSPWILLPNKFGMAEKLSREQYLDLLQLQFKGMCPQCGKPLRDQEQQEAKEEKEKQAGKDKEGDEGEEPEDGDGKQPGDKDGEGKKPGDKGQKGKEKGKGKGGKGDEEGEGDGEGSEQGCGCGEDHGEGEGCGGECGDGCCDCGDDPYASGQMGDHSGWDKSELADSQIREWVANIDARKAWGNMSYEMPEMIRASQKSEVKWTTVLRHYYGQISTTSKRSTFKKPSRRAWYPWTGKVSECVDRKLVCIDTSGSVSSKLLSKFLGETNRLAQVQPVDMVSWDAGVTVKKPIPWDRKKLNFAFSGRGGTDPQPCLDLAKKMGYKEAVFFTDGYFSPPTKPEGVRILWVISPDGTADNLPFGVVIRMKVEPD